MPIHFTKMHGLGNDFVVIEAIHQKIALTPAQISILADRHKGIGFDQLLIVEPTPHPDADFGYRIFNADGSESFQCGNGARCIARFIAEKHLSNKKHIRVATRANCHDLILEDDGLITVNMQTPEFQPRAIPFVADKMAPLYTVTCDLGSFTLSALSLGNPHCVLITTDLQDIDIASVGAALSRHPRFPQGVNVGFMEIMTPEQINLRVYERGVGETQACGSGACAAVVAGRMQKKLAERVTVNMAGGQLRISWAGDHQPVWMTGQAVKVFEGTFELP
jgi:diaminopimelate epimerase